MTRYIATALLAVALIFSVTPAQAALPPIETSRAVDHSVNTDMPGKVIVRIKYRDYGYLGVKPVKACVHDNPAALAHTLRLWVDLPGKTVYMGEYKTGDAKCRRLPVWARKIVKSRSWVGYGDAVLYRAFGIDFFTDRFYAKGYMR